MTNKLLAALIALALAGTIGCSSKKVDGEKAEGADTEMAALDGEGGDEFGDEEFAEGDDFGDEFGDEGDFAEGDDFGDEEFAEGGEVDEFGEDDFGGDDFGGEEVADEGMEEFAEDDFGDQVEEQVADLGEEFPAEEPMSDALTEDVVEEPMASEDTFAESVTEPAPVEGFSTEDPMMAAGGMDDSMFGEPVMEEPTKTWVPVKKMNTVPYKKRGVLVNAIYIARPGDDLSTISNKIYNTDKSDELLNVNPWLGRGIKTGDKVYYNSPKRPNDDTQLLTFYEDAGLSPQTYIAKAGDNIRVVAKDLLGDDRSWMEVYATNLDVETKGELTEGTSLRYWPENVSSSATQTMAAMDEPPMDEPSGFDAPPPMDEPPAMEPPPEPSMAANDIPPPPEVPAAGSTLPPPPAPPSNPPPSMQAAAPPPPPAPAPRNRRPKPKAAAAGDNMDDMMLMGGIAVIIIALVSLVIVKRKKSRQSPMDFNTTTHTQIE